MQSVVLCYRMLWCSCSTNSHAVLAFMHHICCICCGLFVYDCNCIVQIVTSATLARVWIVLPTATTKASRCYFVHDIVLLFSMHCRVFCRCMCRMILSLCYVLLCGRAFLVDEPPLVDVLSHAMMNEGWVTSLRLVSKSIGL